MTTREAHNSENAEIQKRDVALIQLHIAEYQSLTTRQSYWMILQVSLVPAVPVYVAVAVGMWTQGTIPSNIMAWATFAGVQLLGYVWAQTMVEYYTSVKYMECVLRPLIKRTVNTDLFWGYEPHLSLHRTTTAVSYELFFPILSTVIFITTGVLRYLRLAGGSPIWDILGGIINLCLLAALWRHCITAVNIRRQWSICDKEVVEHFDEEMAH